VRARPASPTNKDSTFEPPPTNSQRETDPATQLPNDPATIVSALANSSLFLRGGVAAKGEIFQRFARGQVDKDPIARFDAF